MPAYRPLIRSSCLALLGAAALSLQIRAAGAGLSVIPPGDASAWTERLEARFPGLTLGLGPGPDQAARCEAGEQPVSHALLIGGLSEIGPYKISVADDIALLSATLTAQGVAAGRIHAPSPGAPLFAELAEAASAIFEESRCGDSVLIHFSGMAFDTGQVEVAGEPDEAGTAPVLSLRQMEAFSPALRAHAAAGPFLLLAPAQGAGHDLLSAGALSDYAALLRQKGVNVALSFDTNLAEQMAIETRQSAVSDGGLWRNRLTPEGWAAEWPEPAAPWRGALTLFYAASADEVPAEEIVDVPLADGSSEKRRYGAFSFHFATALLAANPATPEGIARVITRSDAATGVKQRSSYIFISTAPTASLLPETAASEPDDRPTDRSIRILSPAETRGAVALQEARVEITGQVIAPARTVIVTVNGEAAEHKSDGSFRHELTLTPGANRIDIVAITADNQPLLRSTEFHFGGDIASLNAGGQSYALIIANQNYPADSGLRALKTPLADAAALEKLLSEKFGFTTSLTLAEGKGSESLMLQDPTRVEIEAALYQLSRVLGPGDSLLIFYAGHGIYEPATDGAFWLPADARADLPFSWLPATAVNDALLRIQAGTILVISDSCYSGVFLRGEAAPENPASPDQDRLRSLQKLAAGRSRMIIASGGNEPVLDGGGGGHSIFARALLTGLETMPDAAFSATELFQDFLLPMVSARAGQLPQAAPIHKAGHEAGEMVFTRVTSAASAP